MAQGAAVRGLMLAFVFISCIIVLLGGLGVFHEPDAIGRSAIALIFAGFLAALSYGLGLWDEIRGEV